MSIRILKKHVEFVKYFIPTCIQTALFGEANCGEHMKNEHGKNSFSLVFLFFNAQSICTQQTKRVTFTLEFGTRL